MLNVIATPVGIDVPIRKLQEKLHSSLMALWSLNPAIAEQNKLYESYGRCYRNRRTNGYIAEVYTSENQYKEVYWNDALYAISFFGIGNNITHGVSEKADVHLVFFVNLAKLKPVADFPHRADEDVRLDILNIIGKFNFGFTHTGTEIGIGNVLREYQGSVRDEGLKNVDMHPVHCFRLNFSLIYKKNNCF